MNKIFSVILLNDKYETRVEVDEKRSQFFFFDHYPTQAEVDEAVARLLEGEQKEEEPNGDV